MTKLGNEDLAERLYREHSRLVYNFLLHSLMNREDAEDATVETFRRVCVGLRGYRSDCSEKVWIMTIAANVAKRVGGRQSREEVVGDMSQEQMDERPTGHRCELMTINRHTANTLLQTLPPDQRRAIWLRVCMEYTDSEAAEILNVPIGTIKAWVWRGLIKMRQRASMEDQ